MKKEKEKKMEKENILIPIPEVLSLEPIRNDVLIKEFDETEFFREDITPVIENCELDEFTISAFDSHVSDCFDMFKLKETYNHYTYNKQIVQLVKYHEAEVEHTKVCLEYVDNILMSANYNTEVK